jgi:hypothetical protein
MNDVAWGEDEDSEQENKEDPNYRETFDLEDMRDL